MSGDDHVMDTADASAGAASGVAEQAQQQQQNQNQGPPAGQGDDDDRKLFCGGLPQEAKEAEIRQHFGQFGDIQSINVKTDAATGRSRGFAFVVFQTLDGVEKAVGQADHVIMSKRVAVKRAQAKQGKVYVGKVKAEIGEEDLRRCFGQYGNVLAVEQPYDKAKNEKKTFCFITFDKEEPAKKLLKEGFVNINGHDLEIKKVTPKPDNKFGGGAPMGFGGGRGGGRGGAQQGGGGPWGGYNAPWGGGYGDYWGNYGYQDPYYNQTGGWGNYGSQGGGNGGSWGGYGEGGGHHGGGPNYAGGKTPRGAGRGAPRGRGMGALRGQRQKPY